MSATLRARVIDRANGYLQSIASGVGSATDVQLLTYQWDDVGNLTERHDANQSLTEVFYYDALNRLDSATLNGTQNLDLSYDALGNITYKSDVGTYSYASTRPHAVTQTSGTLGASFTYDANGSMLTGNGRSYDWDALGKPVEITQGSDKSEFDYGPSRSRYKQVTKESGVARTTTVYIGGAYERIVHHDTGVVEHREHIAAQTVVATQTVSSDTGTRSVSYLHRDHLGSVDTVTDETAQVIARMSFDAFGKMRDPLTWLGDPSSTQVDDLTDVTRRGYTGHEELTKLGLTHMNGRVYDSQVGRMVSADRMIPNSRSSQAYNRYSYVMNQPLSMTDPSGHVPVAGGRAFSIIQDGNRIHNVTQASLAYRKISPVQARALCRAFYCTDPVYGYRDSDNDGVRDGDELSKYLGDLRAYYEALDQEHKEDRRQRIEDELKADEVSENEERPPGQSHDTGFFGSIFGFIKGAITSLVKDIAGVVVGQIGAIIAPLDALYDFADFLIGPREENATFIAALAKLGGTLGFWGATRWLTTSLGINLINVGYYGFYGGAGWGVDQFGLDGPAPLNRIDSISRWHDVNVTTVGADGVWIENGMVGDAAANGPIGTAFWLIGVIPFSGGDALRCGLARSDEEDFC